MARARGQKQYIALTGGLITEASPLAAPEGSTSDELNMDLDLNGMIRVRRKGLKKKLDDRPLVGNITGAYYWVSANYVVISTISDAPDENMDTVTLYFLDASDNSEVASYSFEVLEDTATNPSFSEVRNRLVSTFGASPFLFAKQGDGTLSAWRLDLYIRDFKLIDDGLSASNRPSTLSDEHKYNLYNAGWYQDQKLKSGTVGDPVGEFYTLFSKYPSNADIPALGHKVDTDGYTHFDPEELETPITGNTIAPRGHYIYNIRNIDRTGRIANKDADGSPSKTATQVLDAGSNLTGLGGNLLFRDSGIPSGATPSDPTTRPIRPPRDPDVIEP